MHVSILSQQGFMLCWEHKLGPLFKMRRCGADTYSLVPPAGFSVNLAPKLSPLLPPSLCFLAYISTFSTLQTAFYLPYFGIYCQISKGRIMGVGRIKNTASVGMQHYPYVLTVTLMCLKYSLSNTVNIGDQEPSAWLKSLGVPWVIHQSALLFVLLLLVLL